MVELENDFETQDDWDEENLNVDITTENDNNDLSQDNWDEENEITWEQAIKWKEDLWKASKKIAELKKQVPRIKEDKPNTSNDLELRLFFIENPEFKENKDWILNVLNQEKYKNLTPQEALVIYNLNKPKESKTIVNNVWWNYKPQPKQLWQLDEKEAINLSPNDYIKYLKVKWELK